MRIQEANTWRGSAEAATGGGLDSGLTSNKQTTVDKAEEATALRAYVGANGQHFNIMLRLVWCRALFEQTQRSERLMLQSILAVNCWLLLGNGFSWCPAATNTDFVQRFNLMKNLIQILCIKCTEYYWIKRFWSSYVGKKTEGLNFLRQGVSQRHFRYLLCIVII